MPGAFQFNAEDLRLDATAPGLEVNAGGLRVKRKANGGLLLDATGLFLSVGQGLQLDGGGNLTQKLNGSSLQVDANGLAVKLDGTGSGRLSSSGNGVRVQTGGQGLPVALAVHEIPANQFTYNGGAGTSLSNAALPKAPSTHANAADGFALLKSGIDNMRKVTGAPASAGEWRIDGANKVEIYGDITQSGDTYRLRYTSDV